MATVVLVNPPVTSPFAPPGGLVALGSHLRREGIDVHVVDASAEALHHLVAPARIEGIAPARLESVWRPDGFRPSEETLEGQLGAVEEALSRVSSECFPTRLSLGGCEADPALLWLARTNPFLDYYREHLVPRLAALDPDVIGISYSYDQQALPGISLAREIERAGIEAPVIAGGSALTAHSAEVASAGAHALPLRPGLAGMSAADLVAHGEDLGTADTLALWIGWYGIRGDGERSLLELVRRVERGEDFEDLPGLVRRDDDSDSLVLNAMAEPLPPERMAPFDLSGWPLGRTYLAPRAMAPTFSSRGCRWNRCAFCNRHEIDGSFRELPSETVLETLRTYERDHGVDIALFGDECMTPEMLAILAREIPRRGIRIRFGTMMRIDPGILPVIPAAARAGLTLLSLGLESGSPRVLRLMRKGFRLETAQEVLDACADEGVLVECHVMFGFPGETREEAERTIEFLEQNEDEIHVLSVNPWVLDHGSDVARRPGRYGLTPTGDAPISPDPSSYRVASGLDAAEAVALAESVRTHPVLGERCVSPSVTEERHVLRHLAAAGRADR